MADENNPPIDKLTELLNSYPHINANSPSSWFVWSHDTGLPPKIRLASICHADMRFHMPGYDHLVTACPMRDDLSIRYIRMLITGPFKAFSDLITLKKYKTDYYIQVDHLERWPSNVLFNFCIASRVPIEYPNLLEFWIDQIKLGYPELFAFLLSYSTDGEPFKKAREFPNRNHFWFDPSSDWKLILAGSPDLSLKSFKEYPAGITPTNLIWGKSEDCAKILFMSDEKVAEYFNIALTPKPAIRTRVSPNQLKKLHWDIEAAPIDLAPNPGLAQWHQQINNANAAQLINMIQPDMPNQPQPPQPVNWVVNEGNDVDEDDADDGGLNYPDWDFEEPIDD